MCLPCKTSESSPDCGILRRKNTSNGGKQGSELMDILSIKRSKIKLEEGNSCYGTKWFKDAMRGVKYRPADLTTPGNGYQSYHNDIDTAVFIVSRKNTFAQMGYLLDAIAKLRPDEYDSVILDSGNILLRLWWD